MVAAFYLVVKLGLTTFSSFGAPFQSSLRIAVHSCRTYYVLLFSSPD